MLFRLVQFIFNPRQRQRNFAFCTALALVGISTNAHAQVSANYKDGGALVVGTSTTTCDAAIDGGLRYNTTDNVFEMCNGTAWVSIIAAAPAVDCTPDAFSFTDVTDQSLTSLILSNTLNITGIDAGCVVSVSGSGTPLISVNGGAWVGAATIDPGDSLRVKQISSGSVSTATIAAVTVGSTTDNWSVTTRAGQTRIFATSTTYGTTGVSDRTTADANCASRASALGYSGTWKALISYSGSNAKDVLTITYPVVRANSTSTIVDSVNLWDGSLEAAISTTATCVWTNTNTDGTARGSCSHLTSNSSAYTENVSGMATSTSTDWTATGDPSGYCAAVCAIYCVDQ